MRLLFLPVQRKPCHVAQQRKALLKTQDRGTVVQHQMCQGRERLLINKVHSFQ